MDVVPIPRRCDVALDGILSSSFTPLQAGQQIPQTSQALTRTKSMTMHNVMKRAKTRPKPRPRMMPLRVQ